ncbi:hypothetical protein AGMMS49982_01810 [Bacteroidia bacterium]|nr:hypothetical protein AGMMS49982_01810 [Bacteroidia bacterium]
MEIKVSKIWVDDKSVCIQTVGGEVFCEYFENYPRLCHATPEQRANFEYNNIGIRWEELNEDFSFNGFMNKKC